MKEKIWHEVSLLNTNSNPWKQLDPPSMPFELRLNSFRARKLVQYVIGRDGKVSSWTLGSKSSH